MSAAEEQIQALVNELRVLQSRHTELGGAYRTACDELVRLRVEVEDHRARLHAIRILTGLPLTASEDAA